tara:strand:- start:12837 stop:13238 length:402 start_codon:yes stop_codon:yes gene_type:complete
MQLNIILDIKLSVEDVIDLLCTAFEGGVEYWCESVRGIGGDTSKLPKGRSKVQYEYEWLAIGGDLEIGVDGEIHTLTEAMFKNGMQMWLYKNNNVETVYDYARKKRVLDIGNIDAGDADNIIQYALFGKLVYG